MESILQPQFSGNSFPTSNIKLAAILYTLGFPMRDGMPCSIDLSAGGKRRNIWWFTTEITWGEHSISAALVQNWYDNKAEFEAKYPDHPVTLMRQALDAREWLLLVINGQRKPSEITIGGAKAYSTGDIRFASCLVGAGFHLLKYQNRLFYFLDDGKIANHFRDFSIGFDADSPSAHWPITWMREGLLGREYMAQLIKDPRCVPMVQQNYRGRRIVMSATASRETKHEIFSSL